MFSADKPLNLTFIFDFLIKVRLSTRSKYIRRAASGQQMGGVAKKRL